MFSQNKLMFELKHIFLWWDVQENGFYRASIHHFYKMSQSVAGQSKLCQLHSSVIAVSCHTDDLIHFKLQHIYVTAVSEYVMESQWTTPHYSILHSGISPLSGSVMSQHTFRQAPSVVTHSHTHTHTSTHNFLQSSWKDIWPESGRHILTHKKQACTDTHMQNQNNLFCLWQHQVTLYNNTVVWGERGSWLNEVSGNERWPVSLAHKKGQSGAARTGQSLNRCVTRTLSYSGMSYEHLKGAGSQWGRPFEQKTHTCSK